MSVRTITDLTQRTVGDIMEHRVVTVTADTPLTEVARLLWDERVSGVPVLDATHRPIGFLSASDLVRHEAFGTRYQPPGEEGRSAAGGAALGARVSPSRPTAVRDIMTPVTISVRSTTSVPALAAFLVRAGIHHALVVDRGELAGVVSAFDIVQEVAGFAPAEEEPELPLPILSDDGEC